MQPLLQTLLYDLDKFFFGGNSWQAGLYQQVESLTAEQASWKLSPDRHSAWELLRHINMWKQYTLSIVRNTEKPAAEANWTSPPENAAEAEWQKELEWTRTMHEEIKKAVIEMGDGLFTTEERAANHLRQIICHDAYHAGQIGINRVMQGIKAIE
jgi:hypothetical protein